VRLVVGDGGHFSKALIRSAADLAAPLSGYFSMISL
jgi:hypothetical protein